MSLPFTFGRPALVSSLVALLLMASVAGGQESESDFRSLFNGKTLEGWEGDTKLWRVEDGAIVGQTTDEITIKRNKFLRWSQGELDDFVLRLEFRVSGTERANSGVQIRSQSDAEGHMAGYQADIDRSGTYIGILYSERTGRGILCQRGQQVVQRSKQDRDVKQAGDPETILKQIKLDDWNEMEIIGQGNHLIIKINGAVTADFTDEDAKQFKASGQLGLQLHVGPPMKIEFRKIRLKRLPLKETKKVVFVAGKPSHGWGAHEHNAGCLLLAQGLKEAAAEQGLNVLTTVYQNGWPQDPTAFDNADTIVAYCDGGGRHFLHRNGEAFDTVMRRGVGLVCLHYGVEVPKGASGQRFLNWIGGYFETDWSVNPHWLAEFTSIPPHPVTRGVQPFELQDEWYYHMRFSEEMTRVMPVLTAMPPASTLERKDGPHSGNPHVRDAVLNKKLPQHLAWAFERGDGVGRGFGFTGGHFHQNWANDNFRTLVLNAIVWTAHGDVPELGVQSATPSVADLEANQDYPKPEKKKKGDTSRP